MLSERIFELVQWPAAGEYAPMDLSQRTRGLQSIVRRFPIGPVSMGVPLQLPAQPGCPQDSACSGCRVSCQCGA